MAIAAIAQQHGSKTSSDNAVTVEPEEFDDTCQVQRCTELSVSSVARDRLFQWYRSCTVVCVVYE